MSTAQPTLADIWLLFKETDLKFKETDRRFQEGERRFQETERLMKENFRETERLIKESSLETERLIKESSLETERLMKESSLETDQRIKAVTSSIGDLNNRLGEFVEYMVRPAAVRLFQTRGIDIHVVHYNVTGKRDGEEVEIDLLVTNDQDVVVIECKSKLTIEYVDEHLKRLGKIKKVMPVYREHRIMGAVAAMVLPDNVAKYAYRKGLFVICQNGDHVVIRNDDKFSPAIW